MWPTVNVRCSFESNTIRRCTRVTAIEPAADRRHCSPTNFQRLRVGKRFGKTFYKTRCYLFERERVRERERKRVRNERIMSLVRYRVYISFYRFYVYRVNRRVHPLIVSRACNLNSCVRTVRRRGGTFSFVATETNTRYIRIIYDMARHGRVFYFKYERFNRDTEIRLIFPGIQNDTVWTDLGASSKYANELEHFFCFAARSYFP